MALLLLSSTSLSSILTSIAELTALFNGRSFPGIPQSYYDDVASEHLTMTHIMGYTHYAVQDGDWTDTATWDTGTVPGLNSVVQIGNYNVVYDGNSTTKIKDIHVGCCGSLTWATDQDTLLWVDTIMCMGDFVIGEQASPIPESTTSGKARAEIVFHQHTAPGTSTRLGLMTMGAVRIHGAPKTDRIAINSVSAGATSVAIPGAASGNWRVGDTIIFMATTNAGTSETDAQYTGPTQFYGPWRGSDGLRTQTIGFMQSHDEVRVITAISGDTVSWEGGLSYNHTTTTHTFANGDTESAPVYVANVSRSIRFRSASTESLQHRAHAMFMHYDDVDIRYLEVYNMGRTASDPSLVRPEGIAVLDSEGGTSITDANNVRGRYPLHIHKTGQFIGRKQVRVIGCSVWAGVDAPPIPGWAMVHHNSRVSFENNVVYNYRGAGLVSEVGNEIGQWINNTVIWGRGDGFDVDWGSRQEVWTNHNGHAGVAYENQARQVLCQGNIASSCHFTWLYLQQNTNLIDRVPDEHSLRYFEPLAQGGGWGSGYSPGNPFTGTYGVEQAQIPSFKDNYSYGCRVGFLVAHRQFTNRTDNIPLVLERFHCIATDTPVHIPNYAFNYYWFNSIWTGSGGTDACILGNVSWQFNFTRIYLENYSRGFVQGGTGLNYDGLFIDIESDSVTTLFGKFDVTGWDISGLSDDISNHPMYNVMGAWTTTSQVGSIWSGTLRQFANVDSSTDLPVHLPNWPDLATEPAPGTPKPYFTLNPSSDTTVNGQLSLSLWGIITDSIGNRRWPDWFSSESFTPETTFAFKKRENEDMVARDVVERNGCFLDGSTYKSRLWFTSVDRLTGKKFQFPIDVTIADGSVDQAILDANIVNPAIKPEADLVPERTPWLPIAANNSPLQIITASTIENTENTELSHTLKANSGQVDWSIVGGADSAQFEIAVVNGAAVLRWASNGTQDFEAPADADTNNQYVVQVRAMRMPGMTMATQTITVTVANDAADDGFAPTTISGCVGWYDFSDATTITHDASISATAGLVSQVNDKSGNFYHATQSDDARKPTTGTRTVNSLNCLDCHDDRLTFPSGLHTISAAENTVFFVMAHDNPSFIQVGMLLGISGGSSRYSMIYNTNPGTFIAQSSVSQASNAFARDTEPHIWGFRAGTLVEPFIDGTELATTVTRTNHTLSSLELRSGNRTDGRYCEIIFYNRALTDTETNDVGNYLATKWGVTWTNIV